VDKGLNAIDGHMGRRVRATTYARLYTGTAGGRSGTDLPTSPEEEKGTNRISASRLQQLSHILHVRMSFFFDGTPRELHLPELIESGPAIPRDIVDFLATSDGVALVKAFGRIRDPRLRQAIVALVEEIVS
jgi:hypothetical protein